MLGAVKPRLTHIINLTNTNAVPPQIKTMYKTRNPQDNTTGSDDDPCGTMKLDTIHRASIQ
jgi:hypothetical protein